VKHNKYIGLFKSSNGHTYELTAYCNGFIQALFLLTADAINSGKHYQLNSITDENGSKRMVGDILKCGDLLT
jgi:hypothetical protein